MIDLHPPHQPARLNDASASAELVSMAGEGLPLYVWNELVLPGRVRLGSRQELDTP